MNGNFRTVVIIRALGFVEKCRKVVGILDEYPLEKSFFSNIMKVCRDF